MWKNKMEKVDAEVNSLGLQKQLELSKIPNEGLQKLLIAKEALMAQLNATDLELQVSSDKTKDKMKQCERCYEICKADVQIRLDEVRILKDEISSKNDKIEIIEQENVDLKIQLAGKEKDLDEMKKDIEVRIFLEKAELEFQNMKLNEQKMTLEEENARLLEIQRQQKNKIQDFESQVATLKTQLSSAKMSINNQAKDFEYLRMEWEVQFRLELEQKTFNLEMQNKELQETKEQQNLEIHSLKECLKDMKLRCDLIENMHKKRKQSEVSQVQGHTSTSPSQFNPWTSSNTSLLGQFNPFGNYPITMTTPTPAVSASASTVTAATTSTSNGGIRNIPSLMSLQITPPPPPPLMSLEVTPPPPHEY